MSNYDTIKTIIRNISGQENSIGVPKMYVAFMDSLEGGVLLSQVIYYSDKGGRGDGWFYKSYPDWYGELRLSKYQCNKWFKKMHEDGYLETKIKKANGAPTLHFRFDMDAFLELFLEFLKEQTESEKTSLSKVKKPNNGKSKNLTIHSEETSPSITKTTTETTSEITSSSPPDKNDDDVSLNKEVASCRNKLIKEGIDPLVADELAREHPTEHIEYWIRESRRQKALTNRAGYIITRIRSGVIPELDQELEYLHKLEDPTYLNELWQAVLQKLAERVPPDIFTFLAPTEVIRFNRHLFVNAKSVQAASLMENDLRDEIKQLITEIIGKPIGVVCTIHF